jgi:hypothetical protein
MRDKRGAGRVLVGKPEGTGQKGRRRLKPEGNIKVDLQEFGWENVDWIGQAQNRDNG